MTNAIHTTGRSGMELPFGPEESKEEMAKYREILKDGLSSWNQNAFNSDLWQGISEERKRKAMKLQEEAFKKPLFQPKTTGGMVLVNLNEDPKANPECFEPRTLELPTGKSSPMSHLAAEWKNKNDIAYQSNLITIKWFCSIPFPNRTNEDEIKLQESPRGMMCSLINQLLREISERFPKYELKGSLLREGGFTERLANREIEALYELFSALMIYLDPGADVMCVIDEITRYETDQLSEELDYVITRLLALARIQSGGPVASKLVLTCQSRATQINEYFDNGRYFKDNIFDG
ncbi:hypothetical protein HER10_EVM0002830 [Colletotrichum scovillei]|uniref:Uncharacterized protein n=1 Tax=Colletotrichum scovillei TaxID=1209932 RepID=A0A9P7R8Z7_9PEZI|nr:uncharacterized protein HER10_EVM0002830 [Colletotrichum scovillei]KAF4782779.1 hypothetical protein HER10_EVM0002830 [Colletotrichum scovillei]KAG7053115.1 hypothetical protein JMJ77_0000207 [Colletotrichum scovillei]KAG7071411.1 hypothetical protein JMJ76_0004284 [Colletotrichum scovillei]KAG7079661.1 hypothetical protein JMJ78_0006767 [Colletotrichum scovillei]